MKKNSWHLDKKIPIGLVVTICIQIVISIWYASKLDSRVIVLEKNEAKNEIVRISQKDIEFQDYKILLNARSVEKINGKLDSMARDINAIKIAVNAKTPEFGG